MILKAISIVILLLQLTGCATQAKFNQYVSQFVGHGAEALIDQWGYPQKTFESPIDKALTIYQYRFDEIRSAPSYQTPTTSHTKIVGDTVYTTVTPGLHHGGQDHYLWCVLWVEVNQDKKIVGYKSRGNHCVK